MNDQEIEMILRQAPRPTPPPDLEQRLLSDLPSGQPSGFSRTTYRLPFWKRLLPAFSFGVLLLGCFVALGIQTSQLLELKTQNRQLQAALATAAALPAETGAPDGNAAARSQAQQDYEELLRLREEVGRLQAQTSTWAAAQAEHQRWQAEHAAAVTRSAPETDPLAGHRAKALSVNCISNLKQIALAARLWANNHEDMMPPDFLSMTNRMNSPRILVCPADETRPRPTQWSELSPASVTYELVSPGVDEKDPAVVFARCPIHRHVALVDGSVQQLGPNGRLITVDGKTKIESR